MLWQVAHDPAGRAVLALVTPPHPPLHRLTALASQIPFNQVRRHASWPRVQRPSKPGQGEAAERACAPRPRPPLGALALHAPDPHCVHEEPFHEGHPSGVLAQHGEQGWPPPSPGSSLVFPTTKPPVHSLPNDAHFLSSLGGGRVVTGTEGGGERQI